MFSTKYTDLKTSKDWGTHIIYIKAEDDLQLYICKNQKELAERISKRILNVGLKTKITQKLCKHDKNLIYPFNENTTFKFCSKCLKGYAVHITPVNKLELEYKHKMLEELHNEISNRLKEDTELQKLIVLYNSICDEIEDLDFNKPPKKIKVGISE